MVLLIHFLLPQIPAMHLQSIHSTPVLMAQGLKIAGRVKLLGRVVTIAAWLFSSMVILLIKYIWTKIIFSTVISALSSNKHDIMHGLVLPQVSITFCIMTYSNLDTPPAKNTPIALYYIFCIISFILYYLYHCIISISFLNNLVQTQADDKRNGSIIWKSCRFTPTFATAVASNL